MSITDSFDPIGKPLITPADSYRKSPYALDVCVINFSVSTADQPPISIIASIIFSSSGS